MPHIDIQVHHDLNCEDAVSAADKLCEELAGKFDQAKAPKRTKATLVLLFSLFFQIAYAANQPADASQTNTEANPSTSQPQPADLIVKGDYVVTMEPQALTIRDGAVVIKDGIIVAVGQAGEIFSQYSSGNVLSGKQRIVMPGLINGHTHAAMTLLRGIAEDLALMDWLNNYIFPAEIEFVDADFVRIGGLLGNDSRRYYYFCRHVLLS